MEQQHSLEVRLDPITAPASLAISSSFQHSPTRSLPSGYRILLPSQLNIPKAESPTLSLSPTSLSSCPPGSPAPLPSVSFPLFPPVSSMSVSPPRPSLPGPDPPHAGSQLLNFSQLYNLALADRMRLLASLPQFSAHSLPSLPPFSAPAPPSLPILHQRFSPPADLAMFPMAKLDPRLFRIPFPDEPKPQHSYIGLIAMAILSNPEKKLVLADIYQYVLDNFPYFRHRGQGWRNSVRHNLSLNDFFLKAGRAANGKGHYWAIHPACVDDFQKGDFRRRRAQRKVRKHMGMQVEDEDEDDSPPASPPMFEHTPLPLDPFVSSEAETKIKEERLPARQKVINFGVDFLLGKPESDTKLANESTLDPNQESI